MNFAQISKAMDELTPSQLTILREIIDQKVSVAAARELEKTRLALLLESVKEVPAHLSAVQREFLASEAPEATLSDTPLAGRAALARLALRWVLQDQGPKEAVVLLACHAHSFLEEVIPFLRMVGAKCSAVAAFNRGSLVMPGGRIIHLVCPSTDDLLRFQGREISFLGVEEGVEEQHVSFFASRLRSRSGAVALRRIVSPPKSS